jgi:hypothetical protein
MMEPGKVYLTATKRESGAAIATAYAFLENGDSVYCEADHDSSYDFPWMVAFKQAGTVVKSWLESRGAAVAT